MFIFIFSLSIRTLSFIQLSSSTQFSVLTWFLGLYHSVLIFRAIANLIVEEETDQRLVRISSPSLTAFSFMV
jgi:hypothetical protein